MLAVESKRFSYSEQKIDIAEKKNPIIHLSICISLTRVAGEGQLKEKPVIPCFSSMSPPERNKHRGHHTMRQTQQQRKQ